MAKSNARDRLQLDLPLEVKKAIEDAATIAGQSLNDFAVSALAHAAQSILHEQRVTRLSARDHERFLALLDDHDARPNRALDSAANRYKSMFAADLQQAVKWMPCVRLER